MLPGLLTVYMYDHYSCTQSAMMHEWQACSIFLRAYLNRIDDEDVPVFLLPVVRM